MIRVWYAPAAVDADSDFAKLKGVGYLLKTFEDSSDAYNWIIENKKHINKYVITRGEFRLDVVLRKESN